jgi:adenosylcobinamide amidohydrolase
MPWPAPDLLRVDDPVVRWQLAAPARALSSATVGGGLGSIAWIVNAQVAKDYARTDLATHVHEIAAALSCRGPGVGMLTAANVERLQSVTDGAATVHATVGVTWPTWAAAPEHADADISDIAAPRVGTINIVAFLDRPCTDAALVNAVMTITEAKSQALFEAGIAGSGTASDAVCVVIPDGSPAGEPEPFAGPRSPLGAALARATHAAVHAGLGSS